MRSSLNGAIAMRGDDGIRTRVDHGDLVAVAVGDVEAGAALVPRDPGVDAVPRDDAGDPAVTRSTRDTLPQLGEAARVDAHALGARIAALAAARSPLVGFGPPRFVT